MNLLQGCGGLAYSVAEGGFERRQRRAVVDGAKRLGTAGGTGGRQRECAGAFGGIQQAAQELGGEAGHVAGREQVPIGESMPKRGEDTPERTLAGVIVGDGGKTKKPIPARMADQRDAARGQFHGARHRADERPAAKGQQSFVTAHSGTAASHQHVPSLAHMEMITLGLQSGIGEFGGLVYTGVKHFDAVLF